MYRKILVPLDGSETATCSLDDVRAVTAGNPDAEIVLLMAAEPVKMELGFIQDKEESEKNIRAWSEKTLGEIKDRLADEGLNVSSIVTQGRPADAILDYAEKNGIDLIVMSTHGRSGPSRWAFGSVADKVVRSSIVPVLVSVPRGCRLRNT